METISLNGLNQLDFFNHLANHPLFLKIEDVASHAFVQKFLKIKRFAAEGFRLSACLPPPPQPPTQSCSLLY